MLPELPRLHDNPFFIAGISMSQLQSGAARLRIVTNEDSGAKMTEAAAFLRSQADHLKDTARRCTDPVVVSELEQTIEELMAEANRLDSK